VKLPPETPVIMSTASIRRKRLPFDPIASVRRSICRTPYENAAARVPPPENARITRFSGSFIARTRVWYWYPSPDV